MDKGAGSLDNIKSIIKDSKGIAPYIWNLTDIVSLEKQVVQEKEELRS